MIRIVASVLGAVVALLAIIGFFVEGEHLGGLMNVDIALDIIRVVIAAALLYVGLARVAASTTRIVVLIVGVMYVLMGLLAFIDPTMFGLLPTGFTGFDIGFHLVVGAAAVVLSLLPAATRERETASRTTRTAS